MKARYVIGAFLFTLAIAVLSSDSRPLQAYPDTYIGLIGATDYLHQTDNGANAIRPVIAPEMSLRGFVNYDLNPYLSMGAAYNTYANARLYELVNSHIRATDILSATQANISWAVPLQNSFILSGNGEIALISYMPNYRDRQLDYRHDAMFYSLDTKVLSGNGISVWVGWSQIDNLNGLNDDVIAVEVEGEI